ncbi:MAG: PilZ domain-containing protein [Magnetococcus sp. WYHC-3]
MTAPHGTPSKEVPRQDERFRFVSHVRFLGDGGLIIQGRTSDVSLSGAFLEPDPPVTGLAPGLEGVLEVTLNENGQAVVMDFPCIVARVTPRGIGLNFDAFALEETEEAASPTQGTGPGAAAQPSEPDEGSPFT